MQELTGNAVTWSKIFKGKYSGVVRKNTTNNAAITELIPCILLAKPELVSYKDKINEEFIDKIVDLINNNTLNIDNIFVNDANQKFALNLFENLNINDKTIVKKIRAGFNIYTVITNILNEQYIKYVRCYWCYRSKPDNVNSSNPSDIIILGSRDGEEKYIGFSLKSGTINSKEPKLNTSVKAILEQFFDKDIFAEFCRIFNKEMVRLFNDFTCEGDDLNNLNRWTTFKAQHKNNLKNIPLSDNEFRESQKLIKDFLIKVFNDNKTIFKEFFIEKCLGTMNTKNDDIYKFFFSPCFYVIKAFEDKNTAEIITPDIETILNIDPDDINIKNIENSYQNFKASFNDELVFTFTVRTSNGLSCFELPNLKVTLS